MITDNEKFIEIQAILSLSDISSNDCIKINNLIIELSKENEVLKKQLENISEELELVMCDLHNRTSERDSYERKLNESLSQQKEFINYLEDEINNIKKQIKNYDIWQGVDYNFLISKRQFNTEILQKYKKIIGVLDEKE